MNGGQNAASPGGASTKRLPYDHIRDQFLAEIPLTAEEELHYFTRIGMFVFDRWQAIADDHPDNTPIDEAAHDARWDECTQRQLDGIRKEARALIAKEVGRQRALAFAKRWAGSLKDIRWLWKGTSWIVWRMWEAFIGAVGLVLFGIMMISLAPSLRQEIRSEVDRWFPLDEPPQPTDRPIAP